MILLTLVNQLASALVQDKPALLYEYVRCGAFSWLLAGHSFGAPPP